MDLPNKIGERIEKRDDGCWIWMGATNPRGYGNIGYQGKSYKAHRFIYERLVGQIPDGLTLDHLCRVPLCVNPEHLEPCTMRENIRRGSKANLTHCQNGHEFTDENTVIKSNGTRRCRICANERQKVLRISRNEYDPGTVVALDY